MKHTDTPCEELHQSRFKRRFKISQNYIVIIKNPRIIENMMVQKKNAARLTIIASTNIIQNIRHL